MFTKNTKTLWIVLCLLVSLCLCSCGAPAPEEPTPSLWDGATYTTDTVLGEGAQVISVAVEMEGKTVVFAIRTDAETLGEALLSVGLIAGEEGAYGLYVKTVNGVLADYDTSGAYWAFYENGAYAPSGVDTTAVREDTVYRIVYAA